MREDTTCIEGVNLMSKIYIRIGKSDADLLLLYNAINSGLGKICKTAILDFFDYSDKDGNIVKFELPGFMPKKTKKDSTILQLNFSKHETDCIKKLFEMPQGSRSTFIKALLRMYAGKRLINLCRTEILKVSEKKAKEKSEQEIEQEVKQEIKREKTTIFKPEEF